MTTARQQCIDPACAKTYPTTETRVSCTCGTLLDIVYDFVNMPRTLDALVNKPGRTWTDLDASGVWRFRKLMPFFRDESDIVTINEGKTILQHATLLSRHLGLDGGTDPRAVSADGGTDLRAVSAPPGPPAPPGLHLQYEGLNPSGSFKDNGMTAAFTHAKMVNAKVCACASTGNTSASMAIYASQCGIKPVIFIGDGKISFGKLSQALDYGALTLQVAGDFDACLARVRHIAENVPKAGVYLMNSVNPFRLEGQKAVMYRVLEGLNWRVPDWVIVPGGNLGNCAAFGKAFMELRALGLVDRVPRLAVINARGARTLDVVFNEHRVRWNAGRYFADGGRQKVDAEYQRMDAANERAHTIASAIEINRPVNLPKALRALEVMNGEGAASFDRTNPTGVVRSVDDETIKHYKALVGKFGFGCEPASACSVAGAHLLMKEGLIRPGHSVACILTGHVLKDPDITVNYHTAATSRGGGGLANAPVKVRDDLDEILRAMGVA